MWCIYFLLSQFGGLWGLVAAGFTVNNAARTDLGYPTEEDDCTWENQALANLAMAGIIFVYVSDEAVVCIVIFLFALRLQLIA